MDNSVQDKTGVSPVQDVDKKPLVSEAKDESAHRGHDGKKHRTLGNKIYDFGVFGTMAWGGVSTMSALTANEAMNGSNKNFNWLRKLNDNAYKAVSNVLSKTLMKGSAPENIHGMSRNMTMVFILGMGGHTLMAPIKWLEDHRQSNAAKIDKALGTTPPDQQEIEKEPKQSWKSVLSGRMISWASAFGAIAAMGPELTTKVNDYFGERGAKTWMKIKPHADPVKVRKWSDLLAFDILATALTAGVTWGCSRFFAKKHDKNLDTVEDSLYQLNPAAPNPLGDLDEEDRQRSFADKVKVSERKEMVPAPASYMDKIQNEPTASHALS